MLKMLLAIDGSDNSLRATQHVANLISHCTAIELHLLNVQLPVSGEVKRFIDAGEIKGYHHDEAIKALSEARQLLDAADIRYEFHIGVGPIDKTIAQFVKEKQIAQIVMGTRGFSAIGSLVLGSVAQSLVKLSDAAVTLIK